MQAAGKAREVVLLSKAGCHLCEAVESEIRSMGAFKIDLKVVDIEGDAALHDRYWLRIPVVKLGDREVFDATVMDAGGEWKRELARILL
ncbi:MAG: glutaredoxin family protein [Nitrososphaerota archaeon]|nr:glutaredoxin family protein [Nitrososphaerota archaeon]